MRIQQGSDAQAHLDPVYRRGVLMVQVDPLNLPETEEFLGAWDANLLLLGLEDNHSPEIRVSTLLPMENWRWPVSLPLV